MDTKTRRSVAKQLLQAASKLDAGNSRSRLPPPGSEDSLVQNLKPGDQFLWGNKDVTVKSVTMTRNMFGKFYIIHTTDGQDVGAPRGIAANTMMGTVKKLSSSAEVRATNPLSKVTMTPAAKAIINKPRDIAWADDEQLRAALMFAEDLPGGPASAVTASSGNATRSRGLVKKLEGLLSVVGPDDEAFYLMKAFEALSKADIPSKMIDELLEESLDISRQNLEQQAKANW